MKFPPTNRNRALKHTNDLSSSSSKKQTNKQKQQQ
jgi:hypothetical protein